MVLKINAEIIANETLLNIISPLSGLMERRIVIIEKGKRKSAVTRTFVLFRVGSWIANVV